MLGTLSKTQINTVLNSQIIGRIGCYTEEKVYVVPIAYVFDGKYIYAQSQVGMKINMMRKNPNICFEVDVTENMGNWRSVIVWGIYEELKSKTLQTKGMNILRDKLMPFVTSETLKSIHHDRAPEVVEKGFKPIIYRIKITESTGRYEKLG